MQEGCGECHPDAGRYPCFLRKKVCGQRGLSVAGRQRMEGTEREGKRGCKQATRAQLGSEPADRRALQPAQKRRD